MTVLFLPGRWQNDREHGAQDPGRDLRAVLRRRRHTVRSARYRLVDLQHHERELAGTRLADIRADVMTHWIEPDGEARVLVGYSFGATLAVAMAAELEPDALVLIDGGLTPGAPSPASCDDIGQGLMDCPAWQPRLRRQIERRLAGESDTPILSDGRLLDDTEALYLGRCTYRWFPEGVVAELRKLATDRTIDAQVAGLRCPILVVASTSSGSSGERAQAMFRHHRWIRSRLLLVPGLSHLEMICGRRMTPFWEEVGEWLEYYEG
ncbi:pimeloyl-ACP methyl ester carboxylesterase [Microbacterium natoriense]|uniref:Pimeloyl-ACP methyl ester carboxylesterase n=1 Tax=Microbacterium natoriense TaxID=284570 RepID=A0AAW8F0G3_9MICO|nr:pimeloyl-ACP methyl ester carboxylesterase [Microbacterium natoriense]